MEQLLPPEEVNPASPTTSLPNSSWNTHDNPLCLWSRLVHEICSLYIGVGEGGTTHILPGFKNRKPPTVWCGDGDFSPFRYLVTHIVDLIVHCPSGSVGNVRGNFASAFIDVAISL